jgi:formylglycine-generating enzyme required for sulfatase activity
MKYILLLAIAAVCLSFMPAAPVIEMIPVEGGTYKMGTNEGVRSERPVHEVTVNSFLIGKYEITQAQWQAVMGNNPSYFTNCPDCPVEEITLSDVDSFIVRLNQLSGKKYRLPTEAEWEYAALGGKLSKGYRYPGSNDLQEVGWVVHNAGKRTHPVGQKKPNELGIYDMPGNVWELCADYWNPGYYKQSPADNPCNTQPAMLRVTRGGSWRSAENRCYCNARNCNVYDHYRKENFGLRLVLDNPGK